MRALLLLLVLGLCGTALAEQQPADPARPESPLVVAVRMEGQDPGSLTLVVLNRSQARWTILTPEKSIPTGFIRFEIQDAENRSVKSLGPWGGPPTPPTEQDFIAVEPQRAVVLPATLSGRFPLQAGKLYFLTVRVRFFGEDGKPAGEAVGQVPYGLRVAGKDQ